MLTYPQLASARLSSTSPVVLCDVGYQGLSHCSITGNIDNRDRIYSPGLMRMMQNDRSEYIDSMNRYLSRRGNPISYVDWDGRQAVSTSQPVTRPTSQPATAPATQPAHFTVAVKCQGAQIGKLEFPRYEIVSNADFGGVNMEGGFKKGDGDYTKSPCCCKELRWVQVVKTNYSISRKWGDISFVDYREKDPAKGPFYWASSKRPGEWVEDYRNRDGYDLRFFDWPQRVKDSLNKDHTKIYWEAELCLVCVKREDKKIERLQCVKYGFTITLNDGIPVVALNPSSIQSTGRGTNASKKIIDAFGGGWSIGTATGQ